MSNGHVPRMRQPKRGDGNAMDTHDGPREDYDPPELFEIGTIADLTNGGAHGDLVFGHYSSGADPHVTTTSPSPHHH